MTAQALAAALHAIATTDDVRALARLEEELRRGNPGDPEADSVARQAALKRRRLVRAS